MRSVGTIKDKQIYPFIVSIGSRQCKLDIIKPETVSSADLAKNGKYDYTSVYYSIIYDKFFKIKYEYGVRDLFVKTLSVLDKKQIYGFLANGVVPITTSGPVEIRMMSEKTQGGNVNKIRQLVYKNGVEPIPGMDTKFAISVSKSKDMRTLEDFAKEKDLKLDEKDYRWLDSYEAIKDYVKEVLASGEEYQSVDTETSGLNFFHNYKNDIVVGMSHSYKDKQGIFIPFRHEGENILDPNKVINILESLFSNLKSIYQNGSFDKRVFRSIGIEMQVDYELTSLMHIINSQKYRSKELKNVARLLLEEDTIELDEILGKNFNAERVEYIPKDLLTVYACADTDYTRRIFIKLYNQLSEPLKKLYEQDMFNYNLVIDADWYGLPIIEEELKDLVMNSISDRRKMEDYILQYIYNQYQYIALERILNKKGLSIKDISDDKINKLLNTPELRKIINTDCSGTRKPVLELSYEADRYKILYKLLGYPKLRYTPTGELSVGSEYFKDLLVYKNNESSGVAKEDLMSVTGKQVLFEKDEINYSTFPLAYMLGAYSTQVNKCKVYKRLLDQSMNGYTFSPYKYSGTETARLSNAVQTIPGYAKNAIGFRPEDKYGMIVFDFDQIELRCVHNEAIRMWESMKKLPKVANNPNHIVNRYDWHPIVDIFNSFSRDPHTEQTALFNRIKPNQVTKAMRKKGKQVNFAGVYGSSAMTMAKEDLKNCHSEEERIKVVKEWEDTKNRWLAVNLHLFNYFNITKNMGLREIPEEEIPYNIPSLKVGRATSRSGRSRYFELDKLDNKTIAHISNQSRNTFIQAYARDIYFYALQNLTKALIAAGFKDDIRSVIFVHDEDGMIYDKTKINPLWLAAMVYKYCCVRFDDSPIRYYCTPAICYTWEQGKSDKYEIPKEMLSQMSTNLEDYEVLNTRYHAEYVLDKIKDFYQRKCISLLRQYAKDGEVRIEDFDTDKNYFYLGKIKMYTAGKTVYTNDSNLDNVLNLIAQNKQLLESLVVTYQGKPVDWGQVIIYNKDNVSTTNEFIDDLSLDLEDDYDEIDLFEESEYNSDSIFDNVNIKKSIVNKKSLGELNTLYNNIEKQIEESNALQNIMYQEFLNQAVIYLSPLQGKRIDNEGFKKINDILSELNTDLGVKILYEKNERIIDSNITVPVSFKFDKFDKFISNLRRV